MITLSFSQGKVNMSTPVRELDALMLEKYPFPFFPDQYIRDTTDAKEHQFQFRGLFPCELIFFLYQERDLLEKYNLESQQSYH